MNGQARECCTASRALLLAALVSANAGAENIRQDSGLFARVEADLLSEAEPLQSSIDDWGSRFEKGERQWAVAIAELGMRYRGFEISYQQRAQLDLRINEQAATMYGRIERKETLVPGEYAPVDIEVDTFSAEGLRLGYRRQGSGWQIGGGISYLKAEQLISGDIEGGITAISDGDYDLDLRVDYSYHRDAIFDRPLREEPRGEGWAIDLAGAWQIDRHWQLSAAVEDLFARIQWEDAPFTQARGHTDRKTYDEQGYAVFQPLISGREGFHSRYTQKLEARARARLQYRNANWTAALHARHQFDYQLAGFGLGYQSEGGQSLNLVYWPQLQSTALQFQLGDLQAQLSVDSTDWEEAKSALFSIRYGF